jgi:transposase
MKMAFVGNDIASQWFDVTILIEEERHDRRFDNDQSGCKACIDWLKTFKATILVVAFEPTGRYSELFGDFMAGKKNVRLYEVNVRKFRQYARSLEPHVKTDVADAYALAMFAKERAFLCREYQPKTPVRKELRDIQMRIRSILKRTTALKSMQKCGLYSEPVAESIRAELSQLELEHDRVLDMARLLILQDPVLSKDNRMLQTIPGVGEKTAILLLCLIDFKQFQSGRSLSRFLGLTQRKKESGSSVRGRESITKAGNKFVRAALYFPSMSAMQHNPQLLKFSDRLKANGKSWSLIRTAVARKLVTLAWSVVHHGRPYDAQHVGMTRS